MENIYHHGLAPVPFYVVKGLNGGKWGGTDFRILEYFKIYSIFIFSVLEP